MGLDARICLGGDPRLTDVQVRALMGASAGRLRRTPQGWFVEVHEPAVQWATLDNLKRRGAIAIVGAGFRQTATTTARGETLLRQIDAVWQQEGLVT